MFNWLIKLKLAYQLRHLTDDLSTDHLADLLEIAIKSGRRCAHDMAHCESYMDTNVMSSKIGRQACAWRNVFYSSQETKSYLNKHHRRIMKNSVEISRLTRLLEKHGHTVVSGVT
ncbi:MAG: hypothetical protein RSD49_17510 [Hafnia sp.]